MITKDTTKAEIFFIRSNQIVGRFDPYFYRPEFKELEEQLENSKWGVKELGKIIEFSNESWNQKDFFEKVFPYIEISEIDLELGKIKNIQNIKIKEAPSRAKKIVKENDIIISMTRPNRGAISKIKKKQNFSICSTGFSVLRNLKIKEINKNYLFNFLKSKLSLMQMERRMTGGNYPAITEEQLKSLKIPVPPKEIQEKIIDLMDSAYNLKKENDEKAKNLIESIDNFVLEKLEIKIPELKDEMTFLISSKELENNRIDSEFHQEKYRQIEKALENGKYELKKVEELIDLRANENFSLNENKIYEYLDISNIDNKEFKILNYQKELNENLPNSPKKKIENGDFLFSKVRTYLKNICLFEDENDENKILTSAIFIFRKNKEFSNYLFSLFLTNLITKYLEKFDSGSTYPTIKDEDILNLKIPLPPLEIQKEISKEVKKRLEEAKRLKKEAGESLEKAKKEVENILLEK